MECARERTRSWWRCSQQIAPAAAPAEVGRNLCYVVVLEVNLSSAKPSRRSCSCMVAGALDREPDLPEE